MKTAHSTHRARHTATAALFGLALVAGAFAPTGTASAQVYDAQGRRPPQRLLLEEERRPQRSACRSTCPGGTNASGLCYGACQTGFTWDGIGSCWTHLLRRLQDRRRRVRDQAERVHHRQACRRGTRTTARSARVTRRSAPKPAAAGTRRPSAATAHRPRRAATCQTPGGHERLLQQLPRRLLSRRDYVLSAAPRAGSTDSLYCRRDVAPAIGRPLGDCPSTYRTDPALHPRHAVVQQGHVGVVGCKEGWRSDSGLYCYLDPDSYDRALLPCPSGYFLSSTYTCQATSFSVRKRDADRLDDGALPCWQTGIGGPLLLRPRRPVGVRQRRVQGR